MEAVNGVSEGEKGAPQAPSPLTGCYLLVVVGEPHSKEHKDIILRRIAKGLLSWDVGDCHVDLEKELAIITDQAPEGEDARYGERLIQFASENLVTEILIHPAISTLSQCMKNLLSSFTRHRHIIHAGYTFAANGSWISQDGTFSLTDFSEAFQEIEVQRVLRAYDSSISLDIHCSPEGDWTRLPKESFTKNCKVRVNPDDVLTSGSPAIANFLNYISPFLAPTDIETLLESSDVVGNIRFSHPTLYVFPGGQGDAALFGINGFNMLVDGGFARKACFWDFVRHLDRLDAVLLTRLNNSNVNGISSVLRRKRFNTVYPQIGHFFCNIQERKAILSPDGDKDKDPLLINLLEEGQEIVNNLRQLHLHPQTCYRDVEPINLYHKVGHGTLDMYVLSPAKDSKEVREFIQKWNTNDQRLFANQRNGKDFTFPTQNLVSICALLVWQPANTGDNITRILFPGSTPQHKIFEGLDKLKQLECIKHPTCSVRSLAPSITKSRQTKSDKILQDQKENKVKAQQEPKPKAENKVTEENIKNIQTNGDAKEAHVITEKLIKKHDSTESEKSGPPVDAKKADDAKNQAITNGRVEEKIEKAKPKPKPEPKPKVEPKYKHTRSIERKPKPPEKKASPTTPKKTLESKMNGDVKPRPPAKVSPSATPAKSTKEANNRKVVESKYKVPSRKEPAKSEKKDAKLERKPISRRPKETSPGKIPESPVKKLGELQKVEARKSKLEKEGTTDSSTVSTPSADVERKDIAKLSPEEFEQLKARELEELKEEQEVVKEIEAVFRKSEKGKGPVDSDLRKVKHISADDKTEGEKEEYLIIEKEEIEHDSLDDKEAKESETQKILRDSEESEKQRKLSGEIGAEKEPEKAAPPVEEKEKTPESTPAAKEEKEKPKEISAASSDEKQDVSSGKKTGEQAEEENKEANMLESQPDEKFSTPIESGATTAPTLPEDERITLDEIKEDNGDQIIEEKHVKEDTKEKDVPVVPLPPKTTEPVAKIPTVVGIRLDKQTPIRDLVKTPDEVADLPVHEEVDIDHYDQYQPTTPKQEEAKHLPTVKLEPAKVEEDEKPEKKDVPEVKIIPDSKVETAPPEEKVPPQSTAKKEVKPEEKEADASKDKVVTEKVEEKETVKTDEAKDIKTEIKQAEADKKDLDKATGDKKEEIKDDQGGKQEEIKDLQKDKADEPKEADLEKEKVEVEAEVKEESTPLDKADSKEVKAEEITPKAGEEKAKSGAKEEPTEQVAKKTEELETKDLKVDVQEIQEESITPLDKADSKDEKTEDVTPKAEEEKVKPDAKEQPTKQVEKTIEQPKQEDLKVDLKEEPIKEPEMDDTMVDVGKEPEQKEADKKEIEKVETQKVDEISSKLEIDKEKEEPEKSDQKKEPADKVEEKEIKEDQKAASEISHKEEIAKDTKPSEVPEESIPPMSEEEVIPASIKAEKEEPQLIAAKEVDLKETPVLPPESKPTDAKIGEKVEKTDEKVEPTVEKKEDKSEEAKVTAKETDIKETDIKETVILSTDSKPTETKIEEKAEKLDQIEPTVEKKEERKIEEAKVDAPEGKDVSKEIKEVAKVEALKPEDKEVPKEIKEDIDTVKDLKEDITEKLAEKVGDIKEEEKIEDLLKKLPEVPVRDISVDDQAKESLDKKVKDEKPKAVTTEIPKIYKDAEHVQSEDKLESEIKKDEKAAEKLEKAPREDEKFTDIKIELSDAMAETATDTLEKDIKEAAKDIVCDLPRKEVKEGEEKVKDIKAELADVKAEKAVDKVEKDIKESETIKDVCELPKKEVKEEQKVKDIKSELADVKDEKTKDVTCELPKKVEKEVEEDEKDIDTKIEFEKVEQVIPKDVKGVELTEKTEEEIKQDETIKDFKLDPQEKAEIKEDVQVKDAKEEPKPKEDKEEIKPKDEVKAQEDKEELLSKKDKEEIKSKDDKGDVKSKEDKEKMKPKEDKEEKKLKEDKDEEKPNEVKEEAKPEEDKEEPKTKEEEKGLKSKEDTKSKDKDKEEAKPKEEGGEVKPMEAKVEVTSKEDKEELKSKEDKQEEKLKHDKVVLPEKIEKEVKPEEEEVKVELDKLEEVAEQKTDEKDLEKLEKLAEKREELPSIDQKETTSEKKDEKSEKDKPDDKIVSPPPEKEIKEDISEPPITKEEKPSDAKVPATKESEADKLEQESKQPDTKLEDASKEKTDEVKDVAKSSSPPEVDHVEKTDISLKDEKDIKVEAPFKVDKEKDKEDKEKDSLDTSLVSESDSVKELPQEKPEEKLPSSAFEESKSLAEIARKDEKAQTTKVGVLEKEIEKDDAVAHIQEIKHESKVHSEKPVEKKEIVVEQSEKLETEKKDVSKEKAAVETKDKDTVELSKITDPLDKEKPSDDTKEKLDEGKQEEVKEPPKVLDEVKDKKEGEKHTDQLSASTQAKEVSVTKAEPLKDEIKTKEQDDSKAKAEDSLKEDSSKLADSKVKKEEEVIPVEKHLDEKPEKESTEEKRDSKAASPVPPSKSEKQVEEEAVKDEIISIVVESAEKPLDKVGQKEAIHGDIKTDVSESVTKTTIIETEIIKETTVIKDGKPEVTRTITEVKSEIKTEPDKLSEDIPELTKKSDSDAAQGAAKPQTDVSDIKPQESDKPKEKELPTETESGQKDAPILDEKTGYQGEKDFVEVTSEKTAVQSCQEDAAALNELDQELQEIRESAKTPVRSDNLCKTEIDIVDKIELGRKSPKEREQDVAIIVASVAEVLKSDAPLEEFEGKIPLEIPVYSSYTPYTTELRETHITTVESPIRDVRVEEKLPMHPIAEERSSHSSPRGSITSFLDEERKAFILHEKSDDSRVSSLLKDSTELMEATSKIISDIKSSSKVADIAVTDKVELSTSEPPKEQSAPKDVHESKEELVKTDTSTKDKSGVKVDADKLPSGKVSPEVKETLSGKASPEIKGKVEPKSEVSKEEVKVDVGKETKAPEEPSKQPSGDETKKLEEDKKPLETKEDVVCDTLVNLDKASPKEKGSLEVSPVQSGKSTPESKEPINDKLLSDVKETRKSLDASSMSSGKTTPEIKETLVDSEKVISDSSETATTVISGVEVAKKSSPEISDHSKDYLDTAKSPALSGKSTPDIVIHDDNGSDISGRSTPDYEEKPLVKDEKQIDKEPEKSASPPQTENGKKASEDKEIKSEIKAETKLENELLDESSKSSVSSGKASPDSQITVPDSKPTNAKETDKSREVKDSSPSRSGKIETDSKASESHVSSSKTSDSQTTVQESQPADVKETDKSKEVKDASSSLSGKVETDTKMSESHASSSETSPDSQTTVQDSKHADTKETDKSKEVKDSSPSLSGKVVTEVIVSEAKAEEFSLVSKAGPSKENVSPSKSPTESLEYSRKSTPDIADVVKSKELEEPLLGRSTPPTVPVSPIVKEKQPTLHDQEKEKKETAVASVKISDVRSSTPASDDCDISSGQVSRILTVEEDDDKHAYSDEDLPGSPLSATSQVAHSTSSQFDFEDNLRGPGLADPMSTSLYGALPDEPKEVKGGRLLDEADLDFDKALMEHRQARGEDFGSGSPSHVYELTTAKFSSVRTQEEKAGAVVPKEGLMTSSFIGSELPSDPKDEKDPIASWGKPLGLPSPAPLNDNKGTPKKERKIPPSVMAKNKLNEDKKFSDKKGKKVNPVYVDLTYVPHHGNSYYSYVDFFKRIRARYYVFSGVEPSREVYNALLEAKQTWEDKDLEVTIIPTYDTDVLGYWVAENEDMLTKCKIDLSPSASRCTINLQDHETSCSAYRLEFS